MLRRKLSMARTTQRVQAFKLLFFWPIRSNERNLIAASASQDFENLCQLIKLVLLQDPAVVFYALRGDKDNLEQNCSAGYGFAWPSWQKTPLSSNDRFPTSMHTQLSYPAHPNMHVRTNPSSVWHDFAPKRAKPPKHRLHGAVHTKQTRGKKKRSIGGGGGGGGGGTKRISFACVRKEPRSKGGWLLEREKAN